MANITYRPLKESDVADAIRLHEQLISSAGAKMGKPYLYKQYATFLAHPSIHMVLGAFKNSQLIGFISATKNISVTENLLNRQLTTLIPTALMGLIRNRYSLHDLISYILVGSTIKQLSDTTTVNILGIAVSPKAQHQGIATQFIGKITSQRKTKTIIVNTKRNNIAAQKFYKKIGFVPVASIANSIILRLKITDTPSAFR